VTTLESRAGEDVSTRGGTLWRLVSADKVPEGAVTVPLGEKEKGTPVSGAEEPSESAATPAASDVGTDALATGTLSVGMNEMFFDPDQIEIPADTDVPVMLENQGVTLHNFTVSDSEISVDVEPGAATELVINLPAGKYRVFCNVPGHKEAGMTARLIVK
jgi:uncharacterized cupredoxin-like copper-binding protein